MALRDRIEKIIEEERENVSGLVGDSVVAQKKVRWRCGLEVLKDYPKLEEKPAVGGRGVTAGFSKVSREISRDRETIKKWVDLVRAVGKTKKEWEIFAEKERARVIADWLKGMGPKEPKQLPYSGPCAIEGVEIFTGDVLEGIANLPLESVHLACIDPPYNIGKDEWDEFQNGDYFEWCQEWIEAIDPVLKKGASVYLFGLFPMLRKISGLMEGIGWSYKAFIVWDTVQGAGGGLWTNRHEDILYYTKPGESVFADKEAITIKRDEENIREYGGKKWDSKNPSNVWYVPCVDEQNNERTAHPTQKPVELYRRMILGSCPEKGLVLDPFMGSGGSAVCCVRTGRNYYGIEKDENYVKMAEGRLNAEKVKN